VGVGQTWPYVSNGICDWFTEEEVSDGATIRPAAFQNFHDMVAPLADRQAPKARQHRELLEQQREAIARALPQEHALGHGRV
jgi:hypothetical protein